MISAAELTGIIYVLGAITFEEICAVEKEISELRDSDHDTGSLDELCIKAVKEHLLESVSAEDVSEAGDNGDAYFITGPNSFPEIPPELSQVIDILKLPVRKVDMDTISIKLLNSFQQKIRRLDIKIEDIEVDRKEIKKLESKYSDLLNLYYDYDSWLPGKFGSVAANLMDISKKIERLKRSN
ncbi:hypothetical protein Metho_0578 [Methanomethylovorans hollandica DSM 15978]|uniref:Uncharacterized protein n=1 Tax=Methanomethylovorans hollandica (strain DSM 15978 / NBRC 107637 / DMS1) TaxID=867904 RepID=L0KXR0_METHD|nr:hypothetical protein [Methanomethylovorans hollandica]AGB48843.1 hypothetical protein Metho_0578 [Methanomethylovorans hollandica DSM 15978]